MLEVNGCCVSGWDKIWLVDGFEFEIGSVATSSGMETEGVSGWDKMGPVGDRCEEFKFEPKLSRDMRWDTCIGAALEGGCGSFCVSFAVKIHDKVWPVNFFRNMIKTSVPTLIRDLANKDALLLWRPSLWVE